MNEWVNEWMPLICVKNSNDKESKKKDQINRESTFSIVQIVYLEKEEEVEWECM